MELIDLTSNDYRLILDFQSRIFSSAENYGAATLQAFKDLFDGNLAAYSKWYDDLHMNALIASGLSEQFIREAHKKLLQDNTYTVYMERLYSNDWNGIFYSQDYIDSNNEESGLLRHLHTANIYYFATIVLSVDPREHILMFKTKAEGPFSDREKTILFYIHSFLAAFAEIRNSLTKADTALVAANRSIDLADTGRVIIDESLNVITFNEKLFHMIPKEEKCKSISSVVRYLLNTIQNNTGINVLEMAGRISTFERGYEITAEEVSLFVKDRGIESFYILSTHPAYTKEIAVNYEAIRKYRLTDREAQIAEMVIKGYPNKIISDNLHLSLSTIKVHISNIFRKLQVRNRAGLTDKLTK